MRKTNTINTKKKSLPLSGHEKKYTNNFWGRVVSINNNNCYAYAVNDYEGYRMSKSIPGERAGLNLKHSYTHCKGLPDRVIADNPKKVYKCKDKLQKIV